MSSLTDKLKARQAAVNAAKEDGAIPGSPAEGANTKVNMDALQNLPPVALGLDTPEVHNVPDVDMEKAKEALEIYEAQRLRKFFLPNGTAVKPEGGYFYAKTEEEVKELEHFASQGLVVKLEA